ncbi:MAG: prolyl oligopeptidase family serine peptidase, partial [Blastocatellia bacterium]
GPLTGVLTLVDLKGAQVATLGNLANASPDLKDHPVTFTAATPAVSDGNYKVHLVLTPADGDPIAKDVDVHVEKGLFKRTLAAEAQANRLFSQLESVHKSELADSLQTILYHSELCRLADEQKISPVRVDCDSELKQSEEELKAVESGTDPFAGRHGDFRRAYLSKVDKSLQPYRVFVPTSYDGSKPHPLIIALHGMGGDENTWFDLYGNGLFKTLAEKHGYIVACPKGRGPASMYQGPAEQDVLDVLAEIKLNYKIDPDRIYLTGHSMGGFGTWSIAISHPDIFAALAPISGGGDPKGMKKIAQIPEIVTHGSNDKTVPVQRSRDMVEAGKKAGAEIKYDEVPGGSHVSVAVPSFVSIFEFFDSHSKNNEAHAKAAAGQK